MTGMKPPVATDLIPDDTLPLMQAAVPILRMLNDGLGRWFQILQEAGEYTTHVEALQFKVVAAMEYLADFVSEDQLEREFKELY